MKPTSRSFRFAVVALVLLASVGLALAEAPSSGAWDAALDLAEKALLERVAADRDVSEKAAAVKSATATVEAITEAVKKAGEAKIAAERVGAADAKAVAEKIAADLEAQVKSARAALDKANADRTAAEKVAQQKFIALNEANKKLAGERIAADKAATDLAKAAGDAITARTGATNTVNQKTTAANQAANAAANSQAAAAKAERERVTAEKAAIEKTATAKSAAESLAAGQAAADKAAAERMAAERTLADKTAAAKSASDAATASRTAAERATAERAVAEKARADRTAAAKIAADALNAEKDATKKKALGDAATRALAERTAAEKTAADKAAAAQAARDKSAADKANAEKAAADRSGGEKLLADKTSAAKAAADKVAAARTAVEKANAEKAAADRVLAERTNTAKAAGDKAGADKMTADKALADKTAAENDLKAKSATERSAVHRAVAARASAEGGLRVLPESAWDYAKARHLLVRAGFGGTPDQVAKLHEMGLVAAVNYLVDFPYQPGDETLFRVDPPERPLPTEGRLSQPERDRINQRRDAKRNEDFNRLRRWWMQRMVESPRPLQEKLTLFWHGHFATEWQKVNWPHLLYQQNQLFRDHAAGNLGGLLYGIVHDPAMIVYLDNQINYKSRPNQNLARELMELFAMGVNRGYTEYDIREGARALTGYTCDNYTGQFRFNYAQHDTEPKILFGQTGPWTGDDFVTLILQQPHTARFITGKLFEYFAYNDPDPAVVTRLAVVLRTNQFELAPVLKNLFLSEEFYSPRAMGTQIKGPVQLVAGLARDFGVKGADYGALVAWCADMGQDLFQPPNVKGWYGGRDWVNANLIFMRYNYVTNLIRSLPQANSQRGIDVLAVLEGKGCTTPAQVVEYLGNCCFVVPLNDEQRRELVEHLGQLPPPEEWAKQRDQLNTRLREVLVLMLNTPGYQMG
jgi:hypothetical protein